MLLKPLAKRILRSWPVLSVYGFVSDAWQEAKYDEYRDRYDISQDFQFNGEGILLYGEGGIVAGADSYIGRFSRISADEGTMVKIGQNCALSLHVMMYTSNRIADQDLSQGKQKRRGDITIGDHCWIGANVFITEGVQIGENAVVGANAVVTDDLPPHSIAAGNPARVLQFKSHLEDEMEEQIRREFAGSIAETKQTSET